MTKIALVAGMVLALAACSKSKWEQAVSDLEGFRDKMCACKSKGDPKAQSSCADDVKKAMDDWEKSMADKMGKDDKPPESLMERGDKADKELRACKKDIRKAGGAAQAKESLAKMSGFKDAMCACKDAACAQKVSDDMSKWGQELAKSGSDPGAMSEDDMKQATEIGKAMADCMTKAMTPPGTP